jgi:hypothetical protein
VKPTIGRVVHYRSHGSADGTYKPECRAAIITAVKGHHEEHDRRIWVVDLTVFNPEGFFLKDNARQDEGHETPGDPDCEYDGRHDEQPFRYCACGWREAAMHGGTWHWVEREPETGDE